MFVVWYLLVSQAGDIDTFQSQHVHGNITISDTKLLKNSGVS